MNTATDSPDYVVLRACLEDPEALTQEVGERASSVIGSLLKSLAEAQKDLYEVAEQRNEALSSLAGLADCINQELRENGPHDDQIDGMSVDMRPFVRRLVDRVNSRRDAYAEKLGAAARTFVTQMADKRVMDGKANQWYYLRETGHFQNLAEAVAALSKNTTRPERCPTCGSSVPHHHPANPANGGLVEECPDAWHKPTAPLGVGNAEREAALEAALRGILRITDRKHAAWDAAHAALGDWRDLEGK